MELQWLMGVAWKGHHTTKVVFSESVKFKFPTYHLEVLTPEIRRDVDYLPRKTRKEKDMMASLDLVDLTGMFLDLKNFPCLFYQLCLNSFFFLIMDVAWFTNSSCNFYNLCSVFEAHVETSSNRTRDWVLQKVITASFFLICFIMLIFKPSLTGGLRC